MKLGAFEFDLGCIACFFDNPWKRPSNSLNEDTKANLFKQAGFSLRAMGRLTETIGPLHKSLTIRINQSDWKEASVCARLLSESLLTLGNLIESKKCANDSVLYSDRSDSRLHQICTRANLANILFQAGEDDNATRLYDQILRMLDESNINEASFNSRYHFHFCLTRYATHERDAWKCFLGNESPLTLNGDLSPLAYVRSQATQTKTDRKIQTLRRLGENTISVIGNIDRKKWLLGDALDHLTMGRIQIFNVIFDESNSESCSSYLSVAISELLNANQVDFLPYGLLTRAWLRVLIGQRTGTDSAEADLLMP